MADHPFTDAVSLLILSYPLGSISLAAQYMTDQEESLMEQGTWQPATWSQATPGDLVKTSAGQWRVIARSGVSGNMIEMSNAKTGAKVKGNPPGDAAVQLWVPDPTPEATDEAIAVIDAEGALGPVEVLSDTDAAKTMNRYVEQLSEGIRENLTGSTKMALVTAPTPNDSIQEAITFDSVDMSAIGVCTECGAVVLDLYRDTHAAWHQHLEDYLR